MFFVGSPSKKLIKYFENNKTIIEIQKIIYENFMASLLLSFSNEMKQNVKFSYIRMFDYDRKSLIKIEFIQKIPLQMISFIVKE